MEVRERPQDWQGFAERFSEIEHNVERVVRGKNAEIRLALVALVALESGNVYVADYNNNAVKRMPPGCSTSSCVTTLGGGISKPWDVAVDGSGNAYVAGLTDSTNFPVVNAFQGSYNGNTDAFVTKISSH